jgi:hypothetical protein
MLLTSTDRQFDVKDDVALVSPRRGQHTRRHRGRARAGLHRGRRPHARDRDVVASGLKGILLDRLITNDHARCDAAATRMIDIFLT